jgi:hypothetical protein
MFLGGRFLRVDDHGTLMGTPWERLILIGYDDFRQACVQTCADNRNTCKLDAQGKVDREGTTLIFCGTLDDCLTGEVGSRSSTSTASRTPTISR